MPVVVIIPRDDNAEFAKCRSNFSTDGYELFEDEVVWAFYGEASYGQITKVLFLRSHIAAIHRTVLHSHLAKDI